MKKYLLCGFFFGNDESAIREETDGRGGLCRSQRAIVTVQRLPPILPEYALQLTNALWNPRLHRALLCVSFLINGVLIARDSRFPSGRSDAACF